MVKGAEPESPKPAVEPEDVVAPRWPSSAYWAKNTAVVVVVVISFALLWMLRSVGLILVASVVLAIGLQPPIRRLENKGLGRGWALAVMLFLGALLLVGLGLVLVSFLINQISAFVEEVPALLERLEQTPGVIGSIAQLIDLESLTSGSGADGGGPPAAFGVVSSLGGTVFNLVTILAVTPYLAVRMPQIKVWVPRLLRHVCGLSNHRCLIRVGSSPPGSPSPI